MTKNQLHAAVTGIPVFVAICRVARRENWQKKYGVEKGEFVCVEAQNDPPELAATMGRQLKPNGKNIYYNAFALDFIGYVSRKDLQKIEAAAIAGADGETLHQMVLAAADAIKEVLSCS